MGIRKYAKSIKRREGRTRKTRLDPSWLLAGFSETSPRGKGIHKAKETFAVVVVVNTEPAR